MNYKDVNDYEVLYLIKENCEEGVDLLYKKYKPLITSFSLQYLNLAKKYGIDYDDLEQEGYIGFSNALKIYNEEKNVLFYTLASICIKRQILTFLRLNNSKKQSVLNNSYSIDMVLDGENNDMEIKNILPIDDNSFNDKLVDIEFNIQLIKKINCLTLMQSCVFYLKYNGFKLKEISNLLDVSVNVVRREMDFLRKRLTR